MSSGLQKVFTGKKFYIFILKMPQQKETAIRGNTFLYDKVFRYVCLCIKHEKKGKVKTV